LSINRRDFIAAATGVAAGFAAGTAYAQSAAKGKLGNIGLQLYTLREMMEKSVPKTLAAVAKAGYQQVETAGLFKTPAPVFRKMLDDNGLTSPSGHIQLENLGQDWEIFLEEASALGQTYLTVAWIDQPDRTVEGYERTAALFNKAALRARGDGVTLAYHTYSYEWTPLENGQTGFDILMRETDPQNLSAEADVFWMRQAGQDVLKWFAKYPGRFHMMHAKDMGPAPKNEMLDVGKGVIDWKNIFAHRKQAGLEYVFVEHDQPKQPLTSIASSYRYLRSLRFAA
jgi:sugar phosphate isomerase/epimerase